jgi:hypothetical protein
MDKGGRVIVKWVYFETIANTSWKERKVGGCGINKTKKENKQAVFYNNEL